MKIELNLMVFFVFVYVFLIIQSLSVFAELIEPSRTLEGQQKPMGRLSVFSEPLELDVLLDSVEIGKTPVISKEVTSGVHILRVKDTEKKITILSGKSLQLSLFKDSLIEILNPGTHLGHYRMSLKGGKAMTNTISRFTNPAREFERLVACGMDRGLV